MDWFSIVGLLLIILVIIFVVLKIMRFIKNKQEENLRAIKYGRHSALEKFTVEEYSEIVGAGVFFFTEYNRFKALLNNNEMTEQEFYDVMISVSQKNNEVGQKYDLTVREMSEYYIFSDSYIRLLK